MPNKDSRQQASHGKTPSAGWLVTAVVAGALSFSRNNAAVFHDFAKVAECGSVGDFSLDRGEAVVSMGPWQGDIISFLSTRRGPAMKDAREVAKSEPPTLLGKHAPKEVLRAVIDYLLSTECAQPRAVTQRPAQPDGLPYRRARRRSAHSRGQADEMASRHLVRDLNGV
jgi:hypothetical protein